jgi:hypothetical protein
LSIGTAQEPRRRARRPSTRTGRAALAIALALAPLAAAAESALRSPVGEMAGEYWDLVARLDSGHWLVAQTYVSNLGPGDGRAGAVGYLITPDGEARRFKRSEEPGQWQVTKEGRRVDLHSIALDPVGPPRRFVVEKPELEADLKIRGKSVPSSGRFEACSFAVLATGAPAEAELRDGEKAAVVATQGRVGLTHRWGETLEADCAVRRVEVFALESEIGVYFAETTLPSGALHRWLVAKRGDEVLYAGQPVDAEVQWEVTAEGFAPPASLRFAAAGIDASVRFDKALASVDPIAQLPLPVQLLVQTRTQPRMTWMRAPFEIALDGRKLRGDAIAKISYLNPVPGGRLPPRVAVRTEGSP